MITAICWFAENLAVPFFIGGWASLITNGLVRFDEQKRILLKALSRLPTDLRDAYREDPRSLEGSGIYRLMQPLDEAARDFASLGHFKASDAAGDVVGKIRNDLHQIALKLHPQNYRSPSAISIVHEEGGKLHPVLPERRNIDETIVHYFAGNAKQIRADLARCRADLLPSLSLAFLVRNDGVYRLRRRWRNFVAELKRRIDGEP
jgi:hypothetical protein